jgi:hypothetical protein
LAAVVGIEPEKLNIRCYLIEDKEIQIEKISIITKLEEKKGQIVLII